MAFGHAVLFGASDSLRLTANATAIPRERGQKPPVYWVAHSVRGCCALECQLTTHGQTLTPTTGSGKSFRPQPRRAQFRGQAPMANQPAAKQVSTREYRKPAKAVLLDTATNEVVFAVVGYVGSGTSEIAAALKGLLKLEKLEGGKFDVEILKAREVISE